MEAIKNLNEPAGSHRTTIANYIEVCILFYSCCFLGCIACFMFCVQMHISFYFEYNVKHYFALSIFCLVSQRFYIPKQLVIYRFNVFIVYKSQIRWHYPAAYSMMDGATYICCNDPTTEYLNI